MTVRRGLPQKRIHQPFALVCLATSLCLSPAATQAQDTDVLEREIARLAEIAGGTVGVAAIHLESGSVVIHNGGDRFPMASSYKVPIAFLPVAAAVEGEG